MSLEAQFYEALRKQRVVEKRQALGMKKQVQQPKYQPHYIPTGELKQDDIPVPRHFNPLRRTMVGNSDMSLYSRERDIYSCVRPPSTKRPTQGAKLHKRFSLISDWKRKCVVLVSAHLCNVKNNQIKMYSMHAMPSPVRLIPASPMIPTSPMTGMQTFLITLPESMLQQTMAINPCQYYPQQHHNCAHLQQHQSSVSMSPLSQQHFPQTQCTALMTAASTVMTPQISAPATATFCAINTNRTIAVSSPLPPHFINHTATPQSPIPFFIQTNQLMSSVPASPVSFVKHQQQHQEEQPQPQPQPQAQSVPSTSLSPIPFSLLEKLPPSTKDKSNTTAKAITTLTNRLIDLLKASTWSLPVKVELLDIFGDNDASSEAIDYCTSYLTDIAIFLDTHRLVINQTMECFNLKSAYEYNELLDELIDRCGREDFNRKYMNRLIRLFIKAKCLRKYHENSTVFVTMFEGVDTLEEFCLKHDITLVRLLLIEGFHFEPEEYSLLLCGNDSLVEHVQSFVENWYSNYSLSMCIQDLFAAQQRAYDPFDLDKFCEEMEAFKAYSEVEQMSPVCILNSLQAIVNMLSILEQKAADHWCQYHGPFQIISKRSVKQPTTMSQYILLPPSDQKNYYGSDGE
ncbi:unnamed protein product [Didymodactylos carnosus]|uniref:Uncharacterized protein n=1 Tax=Didymodactylos carnosus TaxID=1234261 RepID=A0A814QJ31_9BILA|nr:unnamed protein product [Didymodactylos carnosus]CAF1240050.1 unnamed protein product [Didymodactylos carnosus]CAF3884849.1 unnamed protein product [Didymodactylos carnosus]CAF4047498.1 unnamed protein product [Didymodactylos carnosus]